MYKDLNSKEMRPFKFSNEVPMGGMRHVDIVASFVFVFAKDIVDVDIYDETTYIWCMCIRHIYIGINNIFILYQKNNIFIIFLWNINRIV